VAISEADKSAELEYIATIHYGIDLNQFSYQQKTKDYLLYVGRLHPEKGVHDAIEVAHKTGKRLIIAGFIQDEDYFKEQIEPHIDGSKVEYIGSIELGKKEEVMASALAFLQLIHFDEPFSLSVVESMACGTPVIAYDRGSMQELIQNERTGFIVDDLDAAVQAVNKINTLDRRNCRDDVEKRFTCQRMTHKYTDVYHNILGKRENYRPWGHYESLLENNDHKIKELIVNPGERLSLQMHRHRAEHWTVVSGEAVVTIKEKEIVLKPGQSVDIPKDTAHRVMNPGVMPLVLVEIQMGDYFGEDDIIRLEDDYNRFTWSTVNRDT
jgi:mannose-6-phosphate isomerase-like protein (cupin superfamily)